jgi:hypothetical protein
LETLLGALTMIRLMVVIVYRYMSREDKLDDVMKIEFDSKESNDFRAISRKVQAL